MSVEATIRGQLQTLTSKPTSLKRKPSNTQLPYVVLDLVSGVRGYTIEGNDNTKVSRFQINCYGRDYVEAKTIAINAYAIDQFTDNNIKRITILNERDTYDPSTNVFATLIDIEVKEEL